MVVSLITRFIGSKHERDINRMWPLVEAIRGESEKVRDLSDEALAGKTAEFRERLAAGSEVDALLPEAFAVVKEVEKRLCGKSWPGN